MIEAGVFKEDENDYGPEPLFSSSLIGTRKPSIGEHKRALTDDDESVLSIRFMEEKKEKDAQIVYY